MDQKKSQVIPCHRCKTSACLSHYPDGVPEYCLANDHWDTIQGTRQKYREPEIGKMHLAVAGNLKRANRNWPKVREAIEFALSMGYQKVGIAVCVALMREAAEFARFLNHAGLEVHSASCLVGGLTPEDTGVPLEYISGRGISCNPVAQAEILNQIGTELNYVYGLCTGHDTLFVMHSNAPVTFVVAKDMATANNPSGALYSIYHRERMWQEIEAEKSVK